MNLNTTDYWDEQFKKEWQVLNKRKIGNILTGYRWDEVRFNLIGSYIPFRGRLLDIGCGLGNFCRYIRARNPDLEIYGVDFSPKGIELAKKIEPSINYQVAEATELPFPDNYFDIITAQEIIEHLNKPEDALKEWKRVSKGNLLITTPWKTEKLTSKEHLVEWTPKEFTELCSKYFNKIKVVLPPAMMDIIKQKTELPAWFLTICQ